MSKDIKNSRACKLNLTHKKLIDCGMFARAFNAEGLQFEAYGIPSPTMINNDGSRYWVFSSDFRPI